MNEPETIRKILSMKTIAVVGLSDKEGRPSFVVASYLSEHGYGIIPVNPAISEWRGKKSCPSLQAIGRPVEVVDIFRKSEDAAQVVDEAIAIGAKAVWLQEGVMNPAAAQKAEASGLLVVMDRCMKKAHEAFFRSKSMDALLPG